MPSTKIIGNVCFHGQAISVKCKDVFHLVDWGCCAIQKTFMAGTEDGIDYMPTEQISCPVEPGTMCPWGETEVLRFRQGRLDLNRWAEQSDKKDCHGLITYLLARISVIKSNDRSIKMDLTFLRIQGEFLLASKMKEYILENVVPSPKKSIDLATDFWKLPTMFDFY